MELVGETNNVRVAKYRYKSSTYYGMRHKDGRMLRCPLAQFDGDQEAMEFAADFDKNYEAVMAALLNL